jgi:hypothetical protein
LGSSTDANALFEPVSEKTYGGFTIEAEILISSIYLNESRIYRFDMFWSLLMPLQ